MGGGDGGTRETEVEANLPALPCSTHVSDKVGGACCFHEHCLQDVHHWLPTHLTFVDRDRESSRTHACCDTLSQEREHQSGDRVVVQSLCVCDRVWCVPCGLLTTNPAVTTPVKATLPPLMKSAWRGPTGTLHYTSAVVMVNGN